MTYAYKPASQDALDATAAAETDQSFIVYDEETGDQSGIFASENEARMQCDLLNREDSSNPSASDVEQDNDM
ncbi:hypothetical protein GCM10010082_07710 [Kushneria pakistanensis]|uniref:Uncharacterized protein n=1 Tax=Kushneria pakistanensis TaxID=1508770 RepID=A0ABQ3FCQ1_9GAMM|nr:hypothetical protein [Kushneria pakistanensis]GHC18739.1 hypothetical protein GCM10010082_07710 [Kushneria pakistanensis]